MNNDYDLHQKIGMLEDKLVGKNTKIHDLELRVTELENALWRISNPVGAFQEDADKEGTKLNGGMAVVMANDANMLKEWAKSALDT